MVLIRLLSLACVLMAGIHATRAQQDDCHDGSGPAACPVAPFKKILPDAPVEALRGSGGGGHGGGHSSGGHSSGGHASSGSHASTGPAGPGGRVVTGGGFFHGTPRTYAGAATGNDSATCLCGDGCLQGFTNYCYALTNNTDFYNNTGLMNTTDFMSSANSTNATNVMCCNKGHLCSGDECIPIALTSKPFLIFMVCFTVFLVVVTVLVCIIMLVTLTLFFKDLCLFLYRVMLKIAGRYTPTPPQDASEGDGQQPPGDREASGFGLKKSTDDLEKGSEREDQPLLEPEFQAKGDSLSISPCSDAACAPPTYQQNPLFSTRPRAGEPPAFGVGFPVTSQGSGAAAL